MIKSIVKLGNKQAKIYNFNQGQSKINKAMKFGQIETINNRKLKDLLFIKHKKNYIKFNTPLKKYCNHIM